MTAGVRTPPASVDPYVLVDPPTGRVFTSDLYHGCAWLNYSDNEGLTWIGNPVGCGHTAGVHDHQTIGTSKPRTLIPLRYPNLVYYCAYLLGPGHAACATSLNGGLSFGPMILLPDQCEGLHGHVKSAPDGTTYLGKADCGDVAVFRTLDDGLTWTRHVVDKSVGIEGHDVEIATDQKGNVYAFWTSRAGYVHYASSQDQGNTWTPAINVTPPGTTVGTLPTIAAGSEGRLAFAFVASSVAGGLSAKPDVMRSATWDAYILVSPNALEESPIVQVMRVNPAGDPVAVGTCVVRCEGIGDFIDIVIDSQGRPWAAFVDGCRGRCVTDPTSGPTHRPANRAFLATLQAGQALTGEGMLATLED